MAAVIDGRAVARQLDEKTKAEVDALVAAGKPRPGLTVILVGDEEIRRINAEYRKIDRVTDVISFDNRDGGPELGDVFISIEKAREQAAEYGHSFERELGFLACHGFLHCNGYDHLDETGEKAMFALQDIIMDKVHLTR